MSKISTAYATKTRITVRNIDDIYLECINSINNIKDKVSVSYRFNVLFTPTLSGNPTKGFNPRILAGFDLVWFPSAGLARDGFGYHCKTNGSPLVIAPIYRKGYTVPYYVVSWDGHESFLRYLRTACDNVYTRAYNSFNIEGVRSIAYNTQTARTYFI